MRAPSKLNIRPACRTLSEKVIALAATDYDSKKKYDFRKIDIQREYKRRLPLVPCDGARIQQVLLNLLRNAAQAMSQQSKADGNWQAPRIIIRADHEPEEKMVRIEIEDNGPGLDEKTRKRIFEPFFTTKAVGEGTGLGLSVSYFIVTENHRGTMAVESTPGKGANFIVRLPIIHNMV